MSIISPPTDPGPDRTASGQAPSKPTFHDLTTPRALGQGAFTIDVPDAWQQGRGAFGGYVLAVLVRALRASENDADRSLRSLTAVLTGPVLPGPAQIAVQELRQGNAVSTRSVELRQPGEGAASEILAHAVAVFGRSRVRDRERVELTPPERKPWRETPVIAIGPPMAPVFTQHCEFRPICGLPFSGQSGEVSVQGWVRFRSLGPRWEEADLIAAVDTYWPVMLAREHQPRPMATIAFTAQILAHPAELALDSPLYYRGLTLAAHDGYFVEQRELWTEAGQLVVLNQQTMAVVK